MGRKYSISSPVSGFYTLKFSAVYPDPAGGEGREKEI